LSEQEIKGFPSFCSFYLGKEGIGPLVYLICNKVESLLGFYLLYFGRSSVSALFVLICNKVESFSCLCFFYFLAGFIGGCSYVA